MTYNIHPIFVHFPIAFLLLYSFIKIVPFRKWFPLVSWTQIERVLLFVGVLGAMAASSTGETAEHIVKVSRQIVRTHSLFADMSVWIYGALLFGEILSLFNSRILPIIKGEKSKRFYIFIQRILTTGIVSITLSVLGLIAITLTGLLGGVLVYGVSADPVAGIMLQILGLSI